MVVCCVIVNYETAEGTAQAIRALLETDAVSLVVCVDNASREPGTAEVLGQFHDNPRVQVLYNETNSGFARAVNQALGRLDSEHADAVLLINPDVELSSDGLSGLIRHLESRPTCGVVAPRIATPSVKVHSAGSIPTIRRVLCQDFQLHRLFPGSAMFRGVNLPLSNTTKVVGVEWVSGACMLIRWDALKAVGGLSERWFMYAEDQELCARITEIGFGIELMNSVQARHQLSLAASRSPATSAMWLDAQRDYYRSRVQSRALGRVFDLSLSLGFLIRASGRLTSGLLRPRNWDSSRRLVERDLHLAVRCLGTIDPRVTPSGD